MGTARPDRLEAASTQNGGAMTDEMGGTGAPEPMAPNPVTGTERVENPVQQMLSGGGAGWVTLGAWVLIGVHVVLGLFMNEYWIGWMTLLPAVLVVLLPRAGFATKIAPMPVLVKTLAYIIAILGLFNLVEDLRFAGSRFDEGIYILGSLIAYAGYVLVFLGARAIDVD
jgi:hypothetical protein